MGGFGITEVNLNKYRMSVLFFITFSNKRKFMKKSFK